MTGSALDSIRNETRAVLSRHVDADEHVALLDFPLHHNAGDSLIWVGQSNYLEELGVKPCYVSDLFTHSDELLQNRVGRNTIFLNGGGNFGDRWSEVQQFRERIISAYPHNKIVALPQGIDYADPGELEKTAAVYAQHPDLTLLLRETRSYEIALEHFPHNRVDFCPDLAFGAHISPDTAEPSVDVVKLLRVDSEKADHGTVETKHSSVQYDWGLHGRNLAVWHALTVPTRITHSYPRTTTTLYPALSRFYPRIAALNLRVARRILSQGRVVLTDRLHAAVLAAMMGKQVIAMDNANKKVSGIYTAYLHRFENVRYAATTADAADMVAQAVDTAS